MFRDLRVQEDHHQGEVQGSSKLLNEDKMKDQGPETVPPFPIVTSTTARRKSTRILILKDSRRIIKIKEVIGLS